MNKEEREKDPLWFKHAVIYQLHVRAFYDQNDDGIGDFPGLTSKLDYLESLGITAIWLLPFYPSPLRDDGYDISDYLNVNSAYGTLKEFKNFLKEAHNRGIRVITELVIDHTSDQHPWFQRARISKPDSAHRNYYVWSDTPDKYNDARIIFKDFESSNWAWDPIANAYYWHRFYYHQPNLNFESPLVQKEVFKALDFWFEMGVDGLRLDAIPYLFQREGTNCENLPETHEFIKKLRKHVDDNFKAKVLLAEANQWPEDAAAYLGHADECHMAFHFPVMPRLFMAIQMEDRFPIIDILEQTPILPNTCQWIMFLRNHDELTLEMVSDDERDYMYRIYAKDPKARINLGIRRRLAPLLEHDRSKIELMNILLLSLPGTPVIYYGDEIGMGDNYYLGDRNGVRTPMQWSADRNAGFSKANPQKLYLPVVIDPSYHYEAINVENQEQNTSSLLWWVRRILSVYKNHKVFGFGSLEFIASANPKVLVFTRTYEDEIILVVVNLSRYPQSAQLDLTKYTGFVPVEIFHQNRFPMVKEERYNITLGPYNYFWFSLVSSDSATKLGYKEEASSIKVEKDWGEIFENNAKKILEKEILPRYCKAARWFERKGSTIQNVRISAQIPLGHARICLLEITYRETENSDTYLLPISFVGKPDADQIVLNHPQSVITSIQIGELEGILYESIYSEDFRNILLQLILNKKKIKMNSDELLTCVSHSSESIKLLKDIERPIQSEVLNADQSNTSLIYNKKLFLKLFRKLEEGINPDVEIKKFLTEKTHFANVPPFIGSIEWNKYNRTSMSIAILEGLIPNEGTGWSYTLDALTRYYEHVQAIKDPENLIQQIKDKNIAVNAVFDDLVGIGYLEFLRLLGQRTAEMHIALSSCPNDPDFAPEPWSVLYQRALYQSMRVNLKSSFQLLKKKINTLKEDVKGLAEEVIKSEPEILNIYHSMLQKKTYLFRIRVHGDFHLGQVLYTGKDFYMIDFEGEPLQSLSARRLKRSCLRDAAGMIRSFHYVSHKILFSDKIIKPEGMPTLKPWADLWHQKATLVFLEAYFQNIKKASLSLVPTESSDCEQLLQSLLLEKAVYELGYELNARPEWVFLPCEGIMYTLRNKIILPNM
jgi:maltose alpha-D-glucosyltransferase / alpha-amylase